MKESIQKQLIDLGLLQGNIIKEDERGNKKSQSNKSKAQKSKKTTKIYISDDQKKCYFCNDAGKLQKDKLLKKVPIKKCSKCRAIFITQETYNCHKVDLANCVTETISEVKEKKEANEKRIKEIQKNKMAEIYPQICKINSLDTGVLENARTLLQNGYLKNQNNAFLLVELHVNSTKLFHILISNLKRNYTCGNVSLVGAESSWGRVLIDSVYTEVGTFIDLGSEYYIRNTFVLDDKINMKYKGGYHFDVERSINKDERLQEGNVETHNSNIEGNISEAINIYIKLTNKCVVYKHPIESETLNTINIVTGKPINVNVFFCKKCRKYFINYDALAVLAQKGIYPGISYCIDESLDEFTDLNRISELKLYGYSVKEGGMTERERHNLLSKLIDLKLLSKPRIVQYLQFYIGYIGKKGNMEEARMKWENDLNFVNHYVRDNTKVMTMNLVK